MNLASTTASKTPLLTHLTELRQRLLYCLGFFFLMFAVSYWFAQPIYTFLQQPLVDIFGPDSGRRMIYTGLHEAFFTYLKLAFFSALFFTLPLILIQVWRFIAPGLYEQEQKSLFPLFALTPILFIGGAALAFYVVMPMAWEFFISFETPEQNSGIEVQLEAKVSEYLSLVIQLILAFGLCFELPVLLLVMAKAGIINAQTLRQHRRHAVVVVFLLAACLTPPDLISQIALGIPVLLLYELSIALIHWNEKAVTATLKDKTSHS
ncbi:twin-arginine translocase subunit TatC [uncultured Paraglaciecola sp.]|uniref:twin-arginine translocase subunit TatC n=1 Tax=uncultured Paraglaciecola sp. TaxID=1765024 RepID=UPI0030DC7E51|tara:strand:+ start:19874 stop:20665 length:792 start_codon:yes stop_codon:yes gene_type:complete